MKYTCTQCGKRTKEKERTYEGLDWCSACVKAERRRSVAEDVIEKVAPLGAAIFSRPPRYVFHREEDLRKFYPEDFE